jgi:hypothetical protein
MTKPPSARSFVCLGLLLALAGCQSDEVRTYTAPHEAVAPDPKVRLLAAIVPAGDDTWFFKLASREDVVEITQPAFDALVRSVTFTGKGDQSIQWKVPANWESREGPPPRFATLNPRGMPAVELTISKLPRQELKPNLDRWRRLDLGLGPVPAQDVGKYTRTIQVAGRDVTLVDMTGPGVRSKGRGPMRGAGGRPAPPPAGGVPTYTAPEGWTKVGPYVKDGIRVDDSFRVGAGDSRAEVTVLALGGPTGSSAANVNRWRGQVGLGPISEAQLAKDPPRQVELAGGKGTYFDLAGPRKRMLLVVLEKGKQKWYFKMLGDADAVGQQKGAFERFVQSVKFPGAADE